MSAKTRLTDIEDRVARLEKEIQKLGGVAADEVVLEERIEEVAGEIAVAPKRRRVTRSQTP